MRKAVLVTFILSACAWGDSRTPVSAPVSVAPDAVSTLAPAPSVAAEAVLAPAPAEEKWDPGTLAEFPMGCQYKGYELCNPILEWDDLAEEDKGAWGDSDVYFPQKRLYFPMDRKQRDDWPGERYRSEYYLGEWSTANKHTYWSIEILRGTPPHGIIIRSPGFGDEDPDPVYGRYRYVYDCPDMIAKAKNYLVFGCTIVHYNKAYAEKTPLPIGETAYVRLEGVDISPYVWDAAADPKGDFLYLEGSKLLPCLQYEPETESFWSGPGGTFYSPIVEQSCKEWEYRMDYDNHTYKRKKKK